MTSGAPPETSSRQDPIACDGPAAPSVSAPTLTRVNRTPRPTAARLGLAMLVVALVSCGTAPPEHVRIGLVAPLSGPRAAIGQDLVRGAELAIADVNAAGGLLGYDVELVVTDGADLVDVPRRLADLSERGRVSAVIGPEAPGVLVGPRSPLTRRSVPAVLPSAFAGDLEGASTVLTRMVPPADAQAEALARWLVDERDIDRIAVLIADPVEGQAAGEAVLAGLRAGGLEPEALLEVDGRSGQLAPAVSALRRDAPDAQAVFLWGWPDAAARATLAVRALDWDVQIAVPSSSFVGTYRGLAGDASEGVVLPFPFDRDWFGSEVTAWMIRYQAAFGIGALPELDTLVLDIPVVALASYDAVGAIAAAVERADSREPAAVADALLRTEHSGLLRTYDLGDRESWAADDLYVARIHHLGVVYDADRRLDADDQRTFWELQTSAEFLRDLLPDGPMRALVDRLLGDSGDPPAYEPPLPPPAPVGRP